MTNTYKKSFESVLDAVVQHSFNSLDYPILYYIAIGSANNHNEFPDPENRHEYPDYIREMDYRKKVLILIDPCTKIPLDGSGIELHRIESYNDSSDVCDKYESITIQNSVEHILEVYTIRQEIYIDPTECYEDNLGLINVGREFIHNLVSCALMTHEKSLVMISNYTGRNWYHLQDEFINMFDVDRQEDVRNRFLIDSKYFCDDGCYYDLRRRCNQPIIENGYFFNPGTMSPIEYNDFLKKLLEWELTNYQHVDHDSRLVHNQKKRLMLKLFDRYIDMYLDEKYIDNRRLCSQSTDLNYKRIYRLKMIEDIRKLLNLIRSFVDIDSIMDKLLSSNIHSDLSEMKSIINGIIVIDSTLLDV